MSLIKELLAQREALDQQIKEMKAQESGAALIQIHALIAEHEFTVNDIFPGQTTKETKTRSGVLRGKVPAKYRDSATGQTWTGRGKSPSWMAGRDKQEFLIVNN